MAYSWCRKTHSGHRWLLTHLSNHTSFKPSLSKMGTLAFERVTYTDEHLNRVPSLKSRTLHQLLFELKKLLDER